MNVYSLLADRADRTPDAPALLAPGLEPILFRELLDEIGRLGRVLASNGMSPGDRVAVVAHRGTGTAAAVLGVMCTATCVPLNPALPAAEAEAAMTGTGVKAVLQPADVDAAALDAARRLGLPIISAEASRADGSASRRLTATPAPAPDDVAMVLWTSGTTARPKRVPITHRQYVARANKSRRLLGLEAADRCLNLMPLSYAHGLDTGLLAPLSAGGSVICTTALDAETFVACLRELAPTWYTAGATHQVAVLDWLRRRPDARRAHRLRFVRSSAAPLAPHVKTELEHELGVPVVEAYGTSETGTVCANPPTGLRKAGTVGVAPDGEVGITDDGGRLLSPGESGEVVVRGESVVTGYEDDAEADRLAFRDGWFRTGDLGVFDDDGYLTLIGRIKETINRGGEMVSPAEVDAALRAHPAVVEAVTFAVPHPTLGEEVAAAVTMTSPGVAESNVRDFVLERLAPFKVPRRVVVVGEIPKGATGKPLRREAAERFTSLITSPSSAGEDEPVADAHETMLHIWIAALGRSDIGPDDDFFLTGGDSLAAQEVIGRIHAELGVRLSLDALVVAPTLRQLGDLLRRHEVSDADEVVVVNPIGRKAPLFIVAGRGGVALQLFSLLGRDLGPDQPSYGLRPPDSGWDENVGTIGHIADHYLRHVKAIQRSGPYRLLGSSFGGLVAFEMALRLQAMGEEVDFLGMLDTGAPAFSWEAGGAAPRVEKYTGDEASWFSPGPMGRMLRRNAVAHGRARRSYVVDRRFDGVLTYFYCAGEAVTPMRDRRRLWRRAATEGIRLVRLPGLHGGFRFSREPQLSVIREGVRACLEGRPPAGLRPADVFGVRYRLGRDDLGEHLRRSDGREFRVDRTTKAGEVDRRRDTGDMLTVGGWAVDWTCLRPAGTVVAFLDGRYIGYGSTGLGRSDVRATRRLASLAAAGFVLRLTVARRSAAGRASLRVFALSEDGRAVELPYAGAVVRAARRLRWYRRVAAMFVTQWKREAVGGRELVPYVASGVAAYRARHASRVDV